MYEMISLNNNKYNSCFYHAGLSYENRKRFKKNGLKIKLE